MPTTHDKSIKQSISNSFEKVQCQICDHFYVYQAGIFRRHVEQHHHMNLSDYFLEFIDSNGNKCLCGCGSNTKWINHAGGRFIDFVHGHNLKNKTKFTSSSILRRSNSQKETWQSGLRKGGFRDITVRAKAAISRSRTMKLQYAQGLLQLPMMKISHSQRTLSQQKAYHTRMLRNGLCGLWQNIHRGWYESTKMNQKFFYQSGWEKQYMTLLDSDESVKTWIKPTFWIQYRHPFTGTLKRYYPDFLINDRHIVEIKGQLTDVDRAKFCAARAWSEQQNMSFGVKTFRAKKFIDMEESHS